MKVWQLASIVRIVKGIDFLASTAETQPQWNYLAAYYRDFSQIVNRQDRHILDHHLPDDYVETVLDAKQGICYLGNDGHLRSYRLDSSDEPLRFLEIYRTFGGTVLEDVLEYGSVNI